MRDTEIHPLAPRSGSCQLSMSRELQATPSNTSSSPSSFIPHPTPAVSVINCPAATSQQASALHACFLYSQPGGHTHAEGVDAHPFSTLQHCPSSVAGQMKSCYVYMCQGAATAKQPGLAGRRAQGAPAAAWGLTGQVKGGGVIRGQLPKLPVRMVGGGGHTSVLFLRAAAVVLARMPHGVCVAQRSGAGQRGAARAVGMHDAGARAWGRKSRCGPLGGVPGGPRWACPAPLPGG